MELFEVVESKRARSAKTPDLNGRRVLVALVRFVDRHGRFPSVDDLARTNDLSDRGKASNGLRTLERCGLISRTEHRWASGTVHPLARTTASLYEANPAKWLPEPRKLKRVRRPDRPAVVEGTTMYPKQVRWPATGPLRTGAANAKLGGWVTKGHWKGGRILALSLEERKTCPRTCQQWEVCYGDNMGLAVRVPHGPELEQKIEAQLGRMKPTGLVVVRLHELGDFYSVAYVAFWVEMLMKHDWLRIFGYTAWLPGTDIGNAVQAARRMSPDRFVIRTSGHGETMGAVVRRPGADLPDNAFQCPEQEGKVASCGDCGACWSTTKNVAFLQH